MTIAIKQTDLFIFNMRTRMPFKYGIASMTALPHLFARVILSVDGQTATGLAADHLPPKWFTKDPHTPFAEDVEEMLTVIRSAAEYSLDTEPGESIFELWREIYAMQSAWAMDDDLPPLLTGFGVSLVERAMIDAYCRASGITFAQAVRENRLGLELGELHPDLSGFTPADFLPAQPQPQLIARHTVGLGDPLTDADIPPAERLSDGLPQSLAAVIDAYGITHFKLKLFGDPAQDIERLRQIAAVIEERAESQVTDYGFTLDGNENYHQLEPFQELWQHLNREPALQQFMQHLLFVEQPLHRAVALAESTCQALLGWAERPLIIIDESDAEIDSLPTALAGGYAGTSHKNCKGIFKGVANACLLAHHRQIDPDGRYVLSGEDLSNVGPVALLQDCVAMSVLGIDHVERNSHHYFRGLSMFPEDIQQAMLAQHGDLYRRHPAGYPTAHIQQGRIAIGSLLEAPFGYAIDLDPTRFTPVDAWDSDWLLE